MRVRKINNKSRSITTQLRYVARCELLRSVREQLIMKENIIPPCFANLLTFFFW